MDIKVEIKEEIEPDFFNVEVESAIISHTEINSEINIITEEIQTKGSCSIIIKRKSNNDFFESGTDIKILKDKHSSYNKNDETLSKIKTEKLFLKSENQDDDSYSGSFWEEASKNYTITDTHEILQKNEILAKRDESPGHDRNLRKYNVCSLCDYKIHNNSSSNSHCLALHDISTIKRFREKISNKINRCDNLNSHTLAKQNKNAIKKYSCYLCDYKTNHKGNFNSHILAKHDESGIKKYNCNHCDYKTNRNCYFKRHLLSKHDKSAIKKYNCNHCDYKTKNKCLLNNIILEKHDKRAIMKYNCNLCDYKTNRKGNFNILAKHDLSAIKK